MPAPVIAAVAVGAIAGSMKSKSSTSSSSSSESQTRLEAAPEGASEKSAREMAYNQLGALEGELATIGSSDAQRRFASLVDELSKDPSPERIAAAEKFSNDIFAPSQTALQQNLDDQRKNAAQVAANQGRSLSDPILAAKLAQTQIRQQQGLEAERRAFAASEAINAPQRQAQNVSAGLSQLSAQAIQNRQAVFGLGSEFAQQERQYRLATGTQFSSSNSQSQSNSSSGGGLKGALEGGVAGAGAGYGIANQMKTFNAPQQFAAPVQAGGYSGGYSGGMAPRRTAGGP